MSERDRVIAELEKIGNSPKMNNVIKKLIYYYVRGSLNYRVLITMTCVIYFIVLCFLSFRRDDYLFSIYISLGVIFLIIIIINKKTNPGQFYYNNFIKERIYQGRVIFNPSNVEHYEVVIGVGDQIKIKKWIKKIKERA